MEKEIELIYRRVRAVAEMLSVRTCTIRYWCGVFELPVKTDRNGDRLFTSQNIEQLRRIQYLLKVEEYTLSGAKRQMRMNRSNG